MRIFAIGDIHGHYDELQALVDEIEYEAGFDLKSDHLVLLGDLVDAGPKTKEVIEFLMGLQKQYPNTVHALKGNHDHMMVDCLKYASKTYSWDTWYYQGGKQTLQSYEDSDIETTIKYTNTISVPEDHIDWLDNLPYYWETDKYLFVHAGVPPRLLKNLDLTDPKVEFEMMWIRVPFYTSKQKWEKKIIFGHTAFPKWIEPGVSRFEPYVKPNMIGINTMPRNEGKLTCIELPNEVFYFQEKV